MTLLALFRRRAPRVPETDLDRRRDLENKSPAVNPGFDMRARRETARLVGVTLTDDTP